MTKIEWTDRTWNPSTGCSHAGGPGCDSCWARRMSKRLAGRYGYPKAPHQFDVTLHPDRLEKPLKWKKPKRIFVNSMSDLFHEDVPGDFVEQIWQVMFDASHHTFQILTKRPKRMYDWISRSSFLSNDPLTNIWLGVSVEDQKTADERIPLLVQTPAALRFVSYEPALSPVDLGLFGTIPFSMPYSLVYDKLSWVIMGAETGPGARPMHPDWARLIRDQCREADVPFFMKQMSSRAPIPDDLMIREFPK